MMPIHCNRIKNHLLHPALTEKPIEIRLAIYCNHMKDHIINSIFVEKYHDFDVTQIETILISKSDQMKQLEKKDIEIFLDVKERDEKIRRITIVLQSKRKKITSYISAVDINTYLIIEDYNELRNRMDVLFTCKNPLIINLINIPELFKIIPDEEKEVWLIPRLLISKAQIAISTLMSMGKLQTYLNVCNVDRIKAILSSHHIKAISLLTQMHWDELAKKVPNYCIPLETISILTITVAERIPLIIKEASLHNPHLRNSYHPHMLKKLALLQKHGSNKAGINTPCSHTQSPLPPVNIDTTVDASIHNTNKMGDSPLCSFFKQRSAAVEIISSPNKAPRIHFKLSKTGLEEKGIELPFFKKHPLASASTDSAIPQKRLKTY